MGTPRGLEFLLGEHWPPDQWKDLSVLIAVSGGADSVALLRAVVRLKDPGGGRLFVAHFNHKLRGEESAADERFVRDLARDLGLACEVGPTPLDKSTEPSPRGAEAAARRVRYAFLRKTAERLGARYVVTAHTADDQAETVLHRILRGTGVAGLAGMARARPLGPACTLIRPMLSIRRSEVLEYLAALGQPFRTDSSNHDTRFTRNRIRHQLLPQLAREFNPSVVESLLRLGSLAREVQAVVDRQVDTLLERSVDQAAEAVVVDVSRLASEPCYLVRELLIALWRSQGWPLGAMGFVEWDLLAAMAAAQLDPAAPVPRKRVFPGGVTVEVLDGSLRMKRG